MLVAVGSGVRGQQCQRAPELKLEAAANTPGLTQLGGEKDRKASCLSDQGRIRLTPGETEASCFTLVEPPGLEGIHEINLANPAVCLRSLNDAVKPSLFLILCF